MDEISIDPEARASDGALRKRLKRWEPNHLQARFLTFSCYRRLPLLGGVQERDEFIESMITARERHGFRLIAWVVMPEHVHMIIVPTDGIGAGSAMPSILIGLKKPFAQRVLGRWREERSDRLLELRDARGNERFWQAGGGFDRNVRDLDELWREVRYIHRNPVERGLVKEETEWAWSSARWYAGMRDSEVPIDRLDGSATEG